MREETKMFNKHGTLAVVCVATAMLMLDIAVVNTALPRIARSALRALRVQWVIDAYTLALAAVVLSARSLSDRFRRRLIFAIGMGLFTVASLACALACSMALLDGARAVQGVGAAMLFASSLAILADAFPDPAERATAFAVYGANWCVVRSRTADRWRADQRGQLAGDLLGQPTAGRLRDRDHVRVGA
jgi:MFS family permease